MDTEGKDIFAMVDTPKNDDINKVEKLQSKKNRFQILLIVLITALALGFPSWIVTTSVERAQLPTEEIHTLSEEYANNIAYQIPVQLIDLPTPLDGIVNETQSILDKKLIDSRIQIKLFGSTEDVKNAYKFEIIMNEENDALYVSADNDKLISLMITSNTIKHNVVCELIARALVDTVFSKEIAEINTVSKGKKIIEFPFNTNYKISVNFLHSNNRITDFIIDKQNILEKSIANFQSFINTLSPYANFTIEFQEMWFEKRMKTDGEYVEDGLTFIKDTSMFIDYSDWGLDQDVELDPIINLNLYLPDNEKIIIEGSNKNSFLVPQWGGVVIVNDDEDLNYDKLNEVFDIFAFQILKFLGIDTTAEESLYYRIDKRIRIQTVENINQSLNNFESLLKLITQLETIPIPLQTVEQINESIDNIKDTADSINQLNWLEAYRSSTKALQLSNIAFFHKDMLSQAYFPEEHKMAVYSPFLGPFLTIVTLALIKGVKELRS